MKCKIKKSSRRWVAVDTETTGLSVWRGDRPYAVSWCWDDGTTGFVRWKVNPFTRKIVDTFGTYKVVKELLADPTTDKVFHNAKFDLQMLEEGCYFKVNGEINDTLLAMKCLKNDMPSYSLKYLGEKLLGVSKKDQEDLHKATQKARREGKKKNYKIADEIPPDYWLAPPELLEKYAVLDAERTAQLWHFVKEKLKKENLMHIYKKELRLLPVVMAMEKRGVVIDLNAVKKEITIHKKNAKAMYKKVCEIGGVKEINLASPKQVSDLFYKKLKIPVVERTAKGEPSVNYLALAKMDHPIAKSFEQHRASKHAVNSFFQKYMDDCVDEKGVKVLHPNFNQFGTTTARFSCSRPNLQQVADAHTSRSAVGIQARSVFVPRKGYNWYLFDYSQIEVWIFAMVSNEKFMLEALKSGRNLHTENTNKIWGKGTDIVAKERSKTGQSHSRAKAKMLMFGKIYGMGVNAAADLIRCSKSDAEQYLKDFDKAFPDIQKFMNKMTRQVELKGSLINAYGRKYWLDSRYAYRAVNYLVQGSAADLLKEKIIETHEYLIKNKIDGNLIMTIHDEVIFEIRKKYATRNVLKKLVNIMEDHHGVFPQVKKFNIEIKRATERWSERYPIKI